MDRGRRLDLAFADAAASLGPRERAFARELAYGTVRLRGRLDHLLDHHLDRGLSSVRQPLLDVLRLGAYDLLHMDGVPPYAAVSQAVEQAAAAGAAGARGLVNAVLRAVGDAGEDPALFPDFEDDPPGFLSTWGSHPRWLVDRWLARRPADAVRATVEVALTVPPLTLLPLRDGTADAVERLRAAGIEAEPAAAGSDCLLLAPGTAPEAALAALPSIVQDPAAAWVVAYAACPAGVRAADLCAAPGGKALALTRTASYVLAADRSPARLALVRENAARTGAPVGAVLALAEAPPVAGSEFVLLDVPCTGTGTFRRHPDGRWRLGPSDVEALARVQARLLDGAAPRVTPGGVLVYSTCTLEPEENEEQVEAFLRRHPEFRLVPGGDVPDHLLDGRGRLSAPPDRTGFDGAFAARLERTH